VEQERQRQPEHELRAHAHDDEEKGDPEGAPEPGGGEQGQVVLQTHEGRLPRHLEPHPMKAEAQALCQGKEQEACHQRHRRRQEDPGDAPPGPPPAAYPRRPAHGRGSARASSAAAASSKDAAAPMSFWEAAGRGLLTVTMVNETVHENGRDVTLPAGILVTNVGGSPVAITEYPILMSPAPWQSPQPAALATTQDAVLTNGTVPAGGSLLYSYGELVLAGELSEPAWWCMEEMQFTKADAAFAIGGETLPFALRGMLEHPFYTDRGNNTQTALWASLRESPGVVVGKQPLWTELNDTAGQRLRVRIDATNLAIWSTDDGVTADVNVTRGAIEDEVPAGWTVEEGSYSVAPDQVVGPRDLVGEVVAEHDQPEALAPSTITPPGAWPAAP